MNSNRVTHVARITAALLVITAGSAFANYEYVGQFGSFGTAPGEFNDPRGVAVRNGNQIVVSESGNDRIQLCTDTGSCTAFGSTGIGSGQFDRPRGVAVNASGEILVADRGNDRIQICTSTGSW
jgi:DNA-binding beta-propeller fold protein YncE